MEDTKESPSQLSTGTLPSPRESSECSYDFVSSSNVSADEMPPRKVKDDEVREGIVTGNNFWIISCKLISW